MKTAADIMTKTVLTVAPDSLVSKVAGIILEQGVTALPVVDDDRRLLGIVSEGDLVRSAEAMRDTRRSWWLTLLTTSTTDLKEVLGQGDRKVEEVMSRDILLAQESDSLKKLIAMLSRRRIKQLPIVRDGKLVGIVSRIDILRYLAREKVNV
ncbi:MAG: CBS domain-containing protein [Geminicoccaceae bacterium]